MMITPQVASETFVKTQQQINCNNDGAVNSNKCGRITASVNRKIAPGDGVDDGGIRLDGVNGKVKLETAQLLKNSHCDRPSGHCLCDNSKFCCSWTVQRICSCQIFGVNPSRWCLTKVYNK